MRKQTRQPCYGATFALLDGPYPCADCPRRERCGGEAVACEAFSMYVSGQPQIRWQSAPRAPSRELWTALFGVACGIERLRAE